MKTLVRFNSTTRLPLPLESLRVLETAGMVTQRYTAAKARKLLHLAGHEYPVVVEYKHYLALFHWDVVRASGGVLTIYRPGITPAIPMLHRGVKHLAYPGSTVTHCGLPTHTMYADSSTRRTPPCPVCAVGVPFETLLEKMC